MIFYLSLNELKCRLKYKSKLGLLSEPNNTKNTKTQPEKIKYHIKDREDFYIKYEKELLKNRNVDFFLACSIMYDKNINELNYLKKFDFLLPNVQTTIKQALEFFSKIILNEKVIDSIPIYTAEVDDLCNDYSTVVNRHLVKSFSNIYVTYIHIIGILKFMNEINHYYKKNIVPINVYILFYIQTINELFEN